MTNSTSPRLRSQTQCSPATVNRTTLSHNTAQAAITNSVHSSQRQQWTGHFESQHSTGAAITNSVHSAYKSAVHSPVVVVFRVLFLPCSAFRFSDFAFPRVLFWFFFLECPFTSLRFPPRIPARNQVHKNILNYSKTETNQRMMN